MAVGHDLNLDVPTGLEVTLTEDCRVAESGLRLTPRRFQFAVQRRQFTNDTHSASAAARRRLDQHRQMSLGHRGGIEFGEHRHSGGVHDLLGLDLRPHELDGFDGRADPRQSRVDDAARELRVLGEESVSGVNRVGARSLGGGDDELTPQVGLGRRVTRQANRSIGFGDVRAVGICVGKYRDRADSVLAAGCKDTAGDFATIGDQY